MVIILDLSHPIVWLVRHVCSDKAEFSFLQKKTTFQFVVTVIARNRIKGIGLLFFHDRILRFGKNMPQSLKRFLSNFKGLAIQNSLDGFRNTLNVRKTAKPVAGSLSSGVLLVGTGSQQLWRKVFV